MRNFNECLEGNYFFHMSSSLGSCEPSQHALGESHQFNTHVESPTLGVWETPVRLQAVIVQSAKHLNLYLLLIHGA